MSKLFLSVFAAVAPTTLSGSDYLSSFSEGYGAANPLFCLFADRQLSFQQGDLAAGLSEERDHIPAFRGDFTDDAVRFLAEHGHGKRKIDLLCYCHETVGGNAGMLPAWKIQKRLGLVNCLPFSVGQQGSLASVSGVELVQSFFRAEPVQHALLLTIDHVVSPFSRKRFCGFAKGDAAAWIHFTRDEGTYQLLYAGQRGCCLPVSMHQWTADDYERAERMLIDKALLLLCEIRKQQRIDWTIAQCVSRSFLAGLERAWRNCDQKLFQRTRWANINFLGSDPFVTLQEMDSQITVQAGETIALVFVSPDHGVGVLLLQKNN
ncbi:hypothetical protein [Brevibacillus fulvus]|uniref:Beta-ketoacyl-[acyl-carrier-protein] synthase III C-terminal domain-containing protein n=1 Tax=Brevibacillus fulvus TaxID=1125967 RepID=A0A938Y073_9BACL|nr:hypothetical protein [Brevibacillus fulvus]MBM7589641.1 hypothetical protein [Brevibacillus fulvus]